MPDCLGRAAAMLAFVVGAASVSAQMPEPLVGVRRIVCLGDSITQMGEEPGGYVWLLRNTLKFCYPNAGFEVINAGISGHRSTDMSARFDKTVLAHKPDLVTISCGVNDVWHGFYGHPKGDGPNGIPLGKYEKLIREMVVKAKASGARVMILTSTVISEDPKRAENAKLASYNKALFRIAKEEKCPIVDLNKACTKVIASFRTQTGGEENFLTVDGVHMNDSGNRLMADCILTALKVPAELRLRVQTQITAALQKES